MDELQAQKDLVRYMKVEGATRHSVMSRMKEQGYTSGQILEAATAIVLGSVVAQQLKESE